MTEKYCLLRIIWVTLLCFSANIGIAIGFVFLRHKCMNNGNLSFTDSYCLGDSEMRAVVSAIMAFSIFITGIITMNAVNSYRTFHLSNNGIHEGAFVAMASGITYRLRSMCTKWWFVILLIMAFQYCPSSIQTLSNLAIQTTRVYVRNNSTALIYDSVSYYNLAGDVTINDTSYYKNATDADVLFDITTSLIFLLGIPRYSTGYNSMPILLQDNFNKKRTKIVETTLVRSDYITVTNIVDGDTTNSIKRNEVTATVSTSCDLTRYNLTLKSIIRYGGVFPTPVSQKIRAIFFVAKYEVKGANSVVFYSTAGDLTCNVTFADNCTTPSSVFYGNAAICESKIYIAFSKIIYTPSTSTVKIVKQISENTTVNIYALSNLTTINIKSPEITYNELRHKGSSISTSYADVLGYIFYSQNTGLFNTSVESMVHSRYCKGTSDALSTFFALNEMNDYNKYGIYVPMYSIKLQAYIPIHYTYAIFGSIIVLTLIVTITDTVFSIRSPYNIKQMNELCLLDNINNNFVNRRLALAGNLSNDPSGQETFAFSNIILRLTGVQPNVALEYLPRNKPQLEVELQN